MTGLAAVLAGVLTCAARSAEACPPPDPAQHEAPEVVDAGFEVVGPASDGSSTGFLWVKLSPPDGAEGEVNYVAFPISPPAAAQPSDPPRSDQLLFVILIAGFIGIWCWYRRETDRVSKIRVAAAAALASVLFLAVTPAMPWLAAEEPQTGEPAAECLLGEEAQCASYAPAPQQMTAREAAQRTFELQRWECASAALQIGQVMSLVMLLPVLIWLIVAPRSRAAQAGLTVGASVAAFTLLSVFFFRQAIPAWMPAEIYWTVDIAMMTTANVVIAAALVAKHAFAMACPPRLPSAIARRTR